MLDIVYKMQQDAWIAYFLSNIKMPSFAAFTLWEWGLVKRDNKPWKRKTEKVEHGKGVESVRGRGQAEY